MNAKTNKIAEMIEPFRGGELDAHYLGYFEYFNRRLFFEAHEVLEGLWLPQRHGPDGHFYKGLIQLAGAFVHLQKRRPGPAGALFRLAEGNLRTYPAIHARLQVEQALAMIGRWRARLEAADPAGQDALFAGDCEPNSPRFTFQAGRFGCE